MDRKLTGNGPRMGGKLTEGGPEIRQKEFESKIKSFFTPKVVSAIFFLTRKEFIFIHRFKNRINVVDKCHTDSLCHQNTLIVSNLSPISFQL